MDPLWISIAFGFGFLVKRINLPAMIGYLLAGFVLSYLGAKAGDSLQTISDIGIMLLLFTIGLKLRIKTLLHPEIWAGATLHLGLITLLTVAGLVLLGLTSFSLFSLDFKAKLIIAFAMSFSSTVFAVKILEERGESSSLHGKLAIGILIMQDIFAVLFLALSGGKTPNLYAIGLPVALLVLRPILFYLLKKSGHGELLVLLGFFIAIIGGGELFKFAGLKPDLGALVMGMIMAPNKKSKEMYDQLMLFKDIFLIGFFLSIGFYGIITWNILIASLIIFTAISIKTPLYFWVFTRFNLRARTAFFSSMALSSFSEFGLIVAMLGSNQNWIPKEWVVIMSIALSFSFLTSAQMNSRAYHIFSRFHGFLNRFQRSKRLTYDQNYDIGESEIIIVGMGRFGTAAYDELVKKYGQKVLALDYDEERVKAHKSLDRNIIHDDATDIDFWMKTQMEGHKKDQIQI
jgi:glutathione-regulated potassium-efflux system ancillary protein KefC